jgi:hypothetical protein
LIVDLRIRLPKPAACFSIDAGKKFILGWHIGLRNALAANIIIHDLKVRLRPGKK